MLLSPCDLGGTVVPYCTSGNEVHSSATLHKVAFGLPSERHGYIICCQQDQKISSSIAYPQPVLGNCKVLGCRDGTRQKKPMWGNDMPSELIWYARDLNNGKVGFRYFGRTNQNKFDDKNM
jgi:hypothetical protein